MPWKRTAVAPALIAGTAAWLVMRQPPSEDGPQLNYSNPLRSREAQFERLHKREKKQPFDMLVIGGGATGAGIAIDAATRGLHICLVEQEDFGAGTSSRSTKLVHGGVRYLEKAFMQMDMGQLKLVFEALHERRRLLDNAPHLTSSLPIMTPCYSWWEVPYYWAGLKVYDLVAGTQALTMSSFVSAGEAKRRFPTLSKVRSDGRTLKGTVVYHDGQFDDARLAVSLALSAAHANAVVLNYTEAKELIKNKDGKVVGAVLRDTLTGKESTVMAHVVINSTGCFADNLRKKSDPSKKDMILPSAGVHITLPDFYSPDHMGMIVPKTLDGRVVFMLPWMNHTIAGTTDSATDPTMTPQPKEEDIQFVLEALKDYLTVDVRRSDVLSAWSGIRPLAADPTAANTENVSRDHVVAVEGDGMITIAGGKWTTYRKMAEDAVDVALQQPPLKSKQFKKCCTETLKLIGGSKWHPALHTEVAQNYHVPHRPGAIDTGVALHLSHSYGDKARHVTAIAEQQKLGRRLVRGHPMLEAEVVYCCREEYCQTIVDFLLRRTRLAFVDTLACRDAIPRVATIMAAEKGWSNEQKEAQVQRALELLKTFDSPELEQV